MGLFKKIFSIGSRKFKKRSAVDPCTVSSPVQDHFKPSQEDDTEAEVSRLLRSSSGRCAAEPQFGLNCLPPLPHPNDSAVRHPKSSSTTIASVSARSTYSVTIRSRTVHSRTEFPNAYPPMDVSCTPKRSLTDPGRRRSKSVPITPRDKSRLLLLRQDPSVASLLNHYDDDGHLNSALFSNTPSLQDGRVQRHRTGSTLRQLLGHPSSSDIRSGTEGDISWAEKLIGETDCNSSISSVGPRTPADTHFPHIDTHSTDDKTALSINECDTSAANQQTFSSLEVELSISTDLAHSRTLDSPHGKSVTPQRASQVFGFLGDKKRAHDSPVSRLPQPRTPISHFRRFSAESSISDTKNSHIPLRRSCTHVPQPTTPSSPLHFSPQTSAAVLSSYSMNEGSSPLQGAISQRTGQSSPRGPRPTSKLSRQSIGLLCDDDDSRAVTECPLSIQSVLDQKPNADNKYISMSTVRPREMQSQIPKLRSASGSSSSSTESRHNLAISLPRQHVVPLQATVQTTPREADLATAGAVCGKESETLSRLPQPVTPARLFGHHLRAPPSPASSSELSPVAKQMMADLREQRIQARQRERQAGRLGSGHSRIRC